MDLGLIRQLPKKLQPLMIDAMKVADQKLATRIRFSSAQLAEIKKAAVKNETFAADIHGDKINGVPFGYLG